MHLLCSQTDLGFDSADSERRSEGATWLSEEAEKWASEREKDVFMHKWPPVVNSCLFNATCNNSPAALRFPCSYFIIFKLQFLSVVVSIAVRCRSSAQTSVNCCKLIWLFHLHNSFEQRIGTFPPTYVFITLLQMEQTICDSERKWLFASTSSILRSVPSRGFIIAQMKKTHPWRHLTHVWASEMNSWTFLSYHN